MPVRILIVDDHAPFRAALSNLLQAERAFEVVGEAADGLEGIRQAQTLAPDVVVMDVEMPGAIDGVEATRRICASARASSLPLQVIALSGGELQAEAMRSAGAAKFVSKVDAVDIAARIKSMLAATPAE